MLFNQFVLINKNLGLFNTMVKCKGNKWNCLYGSEDTSEETENLLFRFRFSLWKW